MQLTPAWTVVICFMTFSGLMVGFFSPLPWLALLIGVTLRIYGQSSATAR